MVVGKNEIVEAIRTAEMQTSGEVRVHLSNAKHEENILEAAKQSFDALEMHKTRERNGILLYFNTKLRRFAVYGDEGIHQKVGQEFWEHLSAEVSRAIHSKDLTAGIVLAVHQIGQALKNHFPSRNDDRNELGDDITET